MDSWRHIGQVPENRSNHGITLLFSLTQNMPVTFPQRKLLAENVSMIIKKWLANPLEIKIFLILSIISVYLKFCPTICYSLSDSNKFASLYKWWLGPLLLFYCPYYHLYLDFFCRNKSEKSSWFTFELFKLLTFS